MLLTELLEEATWLATLHGEFDRVRMNDGDELDVYAAKAYEMAARYAMLGEMLDDVAIVKKLLDKVPDRLYATVADI
ncbi:retrotransposon protein [Hordeum vulgare]|nr:retrotransposon protein [Hordeum vulgare]